MLGKKSFPFLSRSPNSTEVYFTHVWVWFSIPGPGRINTPPYNFPETEFLFTALSPPWVLIRPQSVCVKWVVKHFVSQPQWWRRCKCWGGWHSSQQAIEKLSVAVLPPFHSSKHRHVAAQRHCLPETFGTVFSHGWRGMRYHSGEGVDSIALGEEVNGQSELTRSLSCISSADPTTTNTARGQGAWEVRMLSLLRV